MPLNCWDLQIWAHGLIPLRLSCRGREMKTSRLNLTLPRQQRRSIPFFNQPLQPLDSVFATYLSFAGLNRIDWGIALATTTAAAALT